jgi:predicted kinase
MEKNKIALILRGVPGSGKSSFTDVIKMIPGDVSVHAVDDLHKDSDGNFVWNEPMEKAYYMLNLANFVKSCAEGKLVVVCDCINIRFTDFQPYLEAAKEFGYKTYVVTPDLPTPEVAATRNSHSVASSQINEMLNDWEPWPV